MVIDGRWRGDWKPSDDDDSDGRFVRKPTSFRGDLDPWEPGRYHLYVAWTCPWAHRVLLVRALKGLQDAIPVHLVANPLTDQGWVFGPEGDPRTGARYLWETYVAADPDFTGRATVPFLVDDVTGKPVNNESSELIRLLDALPSDRPRLSPPDRLDELDALGEQLYHRFNNGVYRAGFATSQEAHEAAVRDVFTVFDEMEARLSAGGPWLLGDQLTEADIRLFVTVARFESAYHGLFKCNRRHLSDFPAVQAHARRLYALPGVSDTLDFDGIREGYYSIERLNPTGIVPLGPVDPLG